MTEKTDTLSPKNLVEKANYMRKNIQDMEKNLENEMLLERYQGIQVHIRGNGVIEKLTIDPEVQAKPMIECADILVQAVNKALQGCEKNRQNNLLSILSQIDEQAP
ncbi:MAG: YbaB/EbfC family nucleoid-associated protein [Pseudomonadota bacterium]|nr:YbaB/EbfC family nucleoid-associated protein [Pseudomonadota bacterium]